MVVKGLGQGLRQWLYNAVAQSLWPSAHGVQVPELCTMPNKCVKHRRRWTNLKLTLILAIHTITALSPTDDMTTIPLRGMKAAIRSQADINNIDANVGRSRGR